MHLSPTDARALIRLLGQCAGLIEQHCRKPREQDTARRARQLIKKLNRKNTERK